LSPRRSTYPPTTVYTIPGHHIFTREGLINMGRHDNKITENGQGKLDLSRTKDVRDASGGRHSDEDKGDQSQQDDQDKQE
jgi:hypothetical protein